jgi:hypothetical protein
MDIRNQDGELVQNIISVYSSDHYHDNRLFGWNVYGINTQGKRELLGTLDEKYEANQITAEITTLISKNVDYYEFPEPMEDIDFEIEIEELERNLFT